VRGALVAIVGVPPRPARQARRARGRAVYVLHSPQVFIALDFAKAAVKELARAGARTQLVTYEGGHGWHGDVFGMIGAGLRWLAAQDAVAAEGKLRAPTAFLPSGATARPPAWTAASSLLPIRRLL